MEDYDLSIFFQTKSQATDFSAALTRVIESLYKTDFQLEKSLLEVFGLKKRDAMMTFLRKHNIQTESTTVLRENFTKMQEYIKTLPVLSLTIAFEPKEETLQNISQWFVGQLHKQMLLEVTVDPHIIAGATMTFQGKFLDYSIKPIFDKALAASFAPKPAQPALHQSTEHITLGR